MNTGKKPYTVGRNTVSVGRILDGDETYESFLDSYSVYYNLKREGTDDPFLAEAVFDSKSEQYFLIRAAKVAEMRSVEYVYFARESDLDAARLKVLDEKAWERGMARVEPGPNHKNTDVFQSFRTQNRAIETSQKKEAVSGRLLSPPAA